MAIFESSSGLAACALAVAACTTQISDGEDATGFGRTVQR